MAVSLNGSTQYLAVGSDLGISRPFAMACWFNVVNTTARHQLMNFGYSSSDVEHWYLAARGDVAGDPIRLRQGTSGQSINVHTTGGYSANTWHHAAGLCVTATDRRVLLDGGNKGTDSTNRPEPTLDLFALGVLKGATVRGYAEGLIAEAAVWDLSGYPEATDSDKADAWETRVLPALAAGFSPAFFKLGLVAYWPLGGLRPDNGNDLVGGYDLAEYNAPGWEEHFSGMIYPEGPKIHVPGAGAPPAGNTPWHLMIGSAA